MNGFGIAHLAQIETTIPKPGPRDVLVRVKAVSLNYKDKLILDGVLMPDMAFPYTPVSDAVGEVVGRGDAVTRFKIGDRVLGQVITDWIDGAGPAVLHQATLGMSLPGVMADYVVFGEEAAVQAPPSLNDAEAATLPIAALTAWSALFEMGKAIPGETVLIQGTGGVSLFALQFAEAFGLRAVVTSSSDEKLALAKAMGAWRTINYRTRQDWDAAVLEATDGRGVNHVIEVVGGENLGRSIETMAAGGRLSLIGILAGINFTASIPPVMRNRLTIQGISIGHRRGFERMNAAIEAAGIKPVIDRVYGFDEVPQAFEHLSRGPFGKIVIALS
jgi:NADPH:quinone reductase-like Zn-dependent oxidoreductase